MRIYVALNLAFSLALCALAIACGEARRDPETVPSPPLPSERAPSPVEDAAILSIPEHCAQLIEASDVASEIPPRTRRLAEAPTLTLAPARERPKIAFISDALGDGEPVQGALIKLREALIKERIDLLVSLGGIGSSRASLLSILGPLSQSQRYLLLALPGDRESLPAHRAVIASLAAQGHRIADGAHYRFVDLGRLMLATMPGISMRSNLLAGSNGCLHRQSDVKALALALQTVTTPTLLLSYAPWRQRGEEASDLGLGGIHVGERMLVPLKAEGPIVASIHGMVEPQSPKTSGSLRLEGPAKSLAAGSLALSANRPSALVITLSRSTLHWKRIPLL